MLLTILITAAGTIAALWALWVLFVTVMHLRRVKNRYGGLTRAQKVLGTPALVIGYVLDVFARLTVFAVLFLRLPRLETVSAMLAREVRGDDWRARQARWWREDLLADFDPTGSHGKPGR